MGCSQFSNSAIQQFSNSAIQQFSNSAIQQFSNSAVHTPKFFKITLIILSCIPGIGCSMTGDITSLDGPSVPSKLDRASTSGFISGSDHYETTLLNKYKIRAEVGSFEGEIRAKTPNGFTLFSSVEGTIASTEGVK